MLSMVYVPSVANDSAIRFIHTVNSDKLVILCFGVFVVSIKLPLITIPNIPVPFPLTVGIFFPYNDILTIIKLAGITR